MGDPDKLVVETMSINTYEQNRILSASPLELVRILYTGAGCAVRNARENLRRLGGYGLVNLAVEWTVDSRTTLFVRGDNVFDRNYELAADFATGGARALQTWSYKIESHFMDAFGRPNPSTVAANTPGNAAGTTICHAVCHFEAPSASAACVYDCGTLVNASSAIEKTIGMTANPSAIPATNALSRS